MLPISLKVPNISFDQAKTVHGGYYIRKQIFGNFSTKIFAEMLSTEIWRSIENISG